MPLFEVAILLKPTKKEAEEGKGETLVFGPEAVVARDQASAGVAAVMKKGAEVIGVEDMNRVEILVRPFV